MIDNRKLTITRTRFAEYKFAMLHMGQRERENKYCTEIRLN